MAHNDENKHGHSGYDPIPDTGKLYETRDVSLSALLKWIAFLFIFVAGTAAVTYVIYKVFVPQGEEASQFPLTRVRQLPDGPRLQANPVQDIKDYREMEVTALGTTGRDPRTGAIHIPIARAMELTLPGLPIRPGAGTIDLSRTTEPNSPSHFDGQAPAGQPMPAGANAAPDGMGMSGSQPAQNAGSTPTAFGAAPPAVPGGHNATSGGSAP